jgi:hypothetical protein
MDSEQLQVHSSVPWKQQNEMLKAENELLRFLLAGQFGVTYTDDGELQNNARIPFIDFKRDSAASLAESMQSRKFTEPPSLTDVQLTQVITHEWALLRGPDITIATEALWRIIRAAQRNGG